MSSLGSLRHSFDWLPATWIHYHCWKLLWNNDEDEEADSLLQTSRIPDSRHGVALPRHSLHCCINKQVQFNRWEALEHSPYNPELAPSNFHLLEPSRQYLPAGHCNTNADVQRYVQCTEKTKNTDVLGDHAENSNASNTVIVWLKVFSKKLYCLTLIDIILILWGVWMSIKYIKVLNKLFTPFCYLKWHLSLWYHCLLLCVLIYD
jgi:hypothetical protein